MAAACFSADLHSIISGFSVKGLTQTQTRVGFIHEREVFTFFDVLEILISDFPDIVAPNHHGEILSHSGDDLIHLGLVLDDCLLDA